MRNHRLHLALLAASISCAGVQRPPGAESLRREVAAAEESFARSMADRDFQAFARHVADDAIFLNGGDKPLRGKEAILAHWKRFFEGPKAPFAWRPEFVEVLPSGTLGRTVGPVTAPDGKTFARFDSTWRREPSGEWRVVFDNGYDACPAPAP